MMWSLHSFDKRKKLASEAKPQTGLEMQDLPAPFIQEDGLLPVIAIHHARRAAAYNGKGDDKSRQSHFGISRGYPTHWTNMIFCSRRRPMRSASLFLSRS